MSNSFTISLPEDLAKHFITYRDDIMNPQNLDFLIKFGFMETAIYDPSLTSIAKKQATGIKMVPVRLRNAVRYPNHFIAIAIRFHAMIINSGMTVEEFITRESTNETISAIKTYYDKAVAEFKRKKLFKTKPASKTKRNVGTRSGTSVSHSKSDKSRQVRVSFKDDINKNALLYYAVKYINDIIAPNGRKSDPEKFQLRGDLLRRAQEFNAAHHEEVVAFKQTHLMARASEYSIDNIIDEKERDKARAIIDDTKRGGFWTYVDKAYVDKHENRVDDFYSLYLIVPELMDTVCEKLNKPEEEDAQQ